MIIINKNRCPVKAISQKVYKQPVINNKVCVECKKCINFCPMRSIKEI
ncbi:MAG: hypothetical protein WCG23_10165 [bacterium]